MMEDYICRLPQDAQQYAKEVLNETEESRKEGLRKIKEWAADNPDLNVRTEYKYILPFLRVSKFNIEKTKEKMKNYYLIKKDVKDWYHNGDPKSTEAQELMKMGCYLILKRNSKGGLIEIIRGTAFDPNKYHIKTLVKIGFMSGSMAVSEDEMSQIYGTTIIADFANLKFGHVRQFSLSLIKEAVYMLQNIPGRPQQVLFVNFPKPLHVFLSIFKTLLPAKIRERVNSKSDGDLTNLFEKEILPIEYGGNCETIDETMIEKMMEYIKWFIEDDKYQAK